MSLTNSIFRLVILLRKFITVTKKHFPSPHVDGGSYEQVTIFVKLFIYFSKLIKTKKQSAGTTDPPWTQASLPKRKNIAKKKHHTKTKHPSIITFITEFLKPKQDKQSMLTFGKSFSNAVLANSNATRVFTYALKHVSC